MTINITSPKSAQRLLPRAQRRRNVGPMAEIEEGRAFVIMDEVDDPMFMRAHAESQTNTRKRLSARNANESPISMLEARGTITIVQAEAALRFRILFERVMAGSASPGDIKERVDGGGGRADVMNEKRMQAGEDLKAAAERLGKSRYWVVRSVCGEGQSLRQVAKLAGARRATVTTALRSGLDDLAEVWRLASRGHALRRAHTTR